MSNWNSKGFKFLKYLILHKWIFEKKKFHYLLFRKLKILLETDVFLSMGIEIYVCTYWGVGEVRWTTNKIWKYLFCHAKCKVSLVYVFSLLFLIHCVNLVFGVLSFMKSVNTDHQNYNTNFPKYFSLQMCTFSTFTFTFGITFSKLNWLET